MSKDRKRGCNSAVHDVAIAATPGCCAVAVIREGTPAHCLRPALSWTVGTPPGREHQIYLQDACLFISQAINVHDVGMSRFTPMNSMSPLLQLLLYHNQFLIIRIPACLLLLGAHLLRHESVQVHSNEFAAPTPSCLSLITWCPSLGPRMGKAPQ